MYNINKHQKFFLKFCLNFGNQSPENLASEHEILILKIIGDGFYIDKHKFDLRLLTSYYKHSYSKYIRNLKNRTF